MNRSKFEFLYLRGFDKTSIADIFDVDESAIDDFCLQNYDMTFDEIGEAVRFVTKTKRDGERPYIVYMHISPSGKKYIGITKSSLTKRAQKGKGYHACPRFYPAIKKYGWENFRHAILYIGLSCEEACQREIELIREFNTTDNRYGYNTESGGRLRKEVSQETREKLRRNSTGVIPSEETRRKMSESHKGINCHWYGTHLTDEEKARLSELRSKPVLCINDNGEVVAEYRSMKEAAKIHGLTRQAISACCSGHRKRCAGYHWRWKDGETAKGN